MKKFKRILAIILVMGLSLTICLPLFGCSGAEETLVVYNWEEYIDESVLDTFEEYYYERTGRTIEVIYSKYDTNETMLTKIMNGDASIDVMCPSEYAIEKLIKADKIDKLDKDQEKYEYLSNVNQKIYQKVEGVFSEKLNGENLNDYYVPYMWGTLGILYNADVISEKEAEDAGWGLLWNKQNNPELEGNIYMKDSIRDAYAAAIMYAKEQNLLDGVGYGDFLPDKLINDTSSQMLEIAENVLLEQRPHLKGYEVDFGKSDLACGIGYVDLAWSGDAIYAIEDLAVKEGVNLAYTVPEIGSNIWFDGWVVTKTSQNKSAAHEFINFLCRPDIAMLNAMEIGYTSAIDKDVFLEDEEALAILEECEYGVEEYFEDEWRYPDIEDENLGVMTDFGESNKDLVEMWERVKASEDGVGTLLIILAGLVGIVGFGVLILIVMKKTGKKRRIAKN